MDSFTVLLDGDLKITPRLKEQIAKTRIIAADGGIRHAKTLNLTPELWLGDFDSTDAPLKKAFQTIAKQSFPIEKDKTDGELAIDRALEHGAKHLILCGAFGGQRIDHGLLHMTLAIALAKRGIASLLTDGQTEGYPLFKGTYQFDLPAKSLVSLIGFTDIEGLTINGAKWNLDKARLPFGSSLALSNQLEGTLHISLHSGYGILLANPNLKG